MAEILPPSKDGKSKSPEDSGTRILQIGQLHLHGNDLAELRKIAAVSPELAEKIVDQRDAEDERGNASYRFGLITSLILLLGAFTAFTVLLVFAGLWATITAVVFILAIALLIRVILTGQWSDTTWFGKFVGAIARALGADTSSPDEPRSGDSASN